MGLTPEKPGIDEHEQLPYEVQRPSSEEMNQSFLFELRYDDM